MGRSTQQKTCKKETNGLKLCNIIATTRVLTHFSSDNVAMIKSCIFEQLGCENESDFICKALNLLYKSLSIESTVIIKDKAVSIADSQMLTIAVKKNEKNNNIDSSKINVNKYVENEYDDRLSQLSSDMIDYFGSFLTKKESILLGCVNKQLLIQTHKESFLGNIINNNNNNENKMSKLPDDGCQDCEFDGKSWIFDVELDSMRETIVTKVGSHIPRVSLIGIMGLQGGKGLEEKHFSCGVLDMAPLSKKPVELSLMTEVFFVANASKKSLLFVLGSDYNDNQDGTQDGTQDDTQDCKSWYLSKGSMFWVPPENEYSITNLSKTDTITLYFVLLKYQVNEYYSDDSDAGQNWNQEKRKGRNKGKGKGKGSLKVEGGNLAGVV